MHVVGRTPRGCSRPPAGGPSDPLPRSTDARAIRCAIAAVDDVRVLGLEIRAGLHTGEVDLHGQSVRSLAVNIGARVGALAGASEVLVSHPVKDLVAGSGPHVRGCRRARAEGRAYPDTQNRHPRVARATLGSGGREAVGVRVSPFALLRWWFCPASVGDADPREASRSRSSSSTGSTSRTRSSLRGSGARGSSRRACAVATSCRPGSRPRCCRRP
jgi:hypothetical protein